MGGYAMQRFMVIRRRKSVWFLLGAALYVLVILLGLGNMVASLASVTDKELPVYSVQRDEPLVALTFNCAWEENDIPQLLDLLEKEKIKATFFWWVSGLNGILTRYGRSPPPGTRLAITLIRMWILWERGRM